MSAHEWREATRLRDSVRPLESAGLIYAHLVAVFPEQCIVAWWNGSATYQMAWVRDALHSLDAGAEYIDVMAVWTDHENERDPARAHDHLAALGDADPAEVIPINDEANYRWALRAGSLGPVYVYGGRALEDR